MPSQGRAHATPPMWRGVKGDTYPSLAGLARDEARAAHHAAKLRGETAVGPHKRLSEVGAHGTDGTLRCPRCGGTNFTAKRSGGGKATGLAVLGIGGALLARKTQVRCVTCGATFKRG